MLHRTANASRPALSRSLVWIDRIYAHRSSEGDKDGNATAQAASTLWEQTMEVTGRRGGVSKREGLWQDLWDGGRLVWTKDEPKNRTFWTSFWDYGSEASFVGLRLVTDEDLPSIHKTGRSWRWVPIDLPDAGLTQLSLPEATATYVLDTDGCATTTAIQRGLVWHPPSPRHMPFVLLARIPRQVGHGGDNNRDGKDNDNAPTADTKETLADVSPSLSTSPSTLSEIVLSCGPGSMELGLIRDALHTLGGKQDESGLVAFGQGPPLRLIRSAHKGIYCIVMHNRERQTHAAELHRRGLLQGEHWTHWTASIGAFRGLQLRWSQDAKPSPFFSEIEYRKYNAPTHLLNKGISCTAANALSLRARFFPSAMSPDGSDTGKK